MTYWPENATQRSEILNLYAVDVGKGFYLSLVQESGIFIYVLDNAGTVRGNRPNRFMPPLEEKHLDGKFDPEKAVHEVSTAPPDEGAAPLRARDLRLKGADAMIYLCAARLGLRPVVLRLVWDECNKVIELIE